MSINLDGMPDLRVPTSADLAEVVKTLREQNKWTQATLAELARVDERTIQRVESGGRVSLDTRRALARAFGCEDLDVFERPWPFPDVEKFKAYTAELERTTIAVALTRIRDGRTLRTMVEGAHTSATEEIGELSSEARAGFAEMVDYLRDYNDIRTEYSMTQRLDVDRDIDELLKRISNQRAAVGAGLFPTRLRSMGAPESPPMDWTNILLLLAPAASLPSIVRIPRRFELA
jgi:transcriptional regulator with XRE-family HTH domain